MYQTDFSIEEFQARRRALCDTVDDGALILIPGSDGPQGAEVFRQYNEFYYYCGVEVPNAYLLVDSRTARTTLFLPRASQVGPMEEGEHFCAENAEAVCAATGVDAVEGTECLPQRIQRAGVLYMPFEEQEHRSVSRDTVWGWHRGVMSNPFDGRPSRAGHILEQIRRRLPAIDIRNISTQIAEQRSMKSPREIDLMRRAGYLTAVGVNEAIRSTQPGATEYQLDAVMRYHFLAGGAGDRGYHSIIPSGANIWHGHYAANAGVLEDGDWLLCDCAPDFHYYTSDIGRMWPINGVYSPRQRALYGYVIEYHKVLLEGIRPGRMVKEIHEEGAERMRDVFDKWAFTSPEDKESARLMFTFGHLSHAVGMAVHDGGQHFHRPLEPGVVFSVDPSLRDRDRLLYVRVEDTVVVTENGNENLTSASPLELDDIEALMTEDGLLQGFPPA